MPTSPRATSWSPCCADSPAEAAPCRSSPFRNPRRRTPHERHNRNAVATRDNSPGGLIKQYAEDFKTVLPTHVKPDTWVRLAQGALKKGKRQQDGRTDLEIAAANNPGVFLAAILDAARLGLEPGTEQFYLTPRKVKGQLEILGIVG